MAPDYARARRHRSHHCLRQSTFFYRLSLLLWRYMQPLILFRALASAKTRRNSWPDSITCPTCSACSLPCLLWIGLADEAQWYGGLLVWRCSCSLVASWTNVIYYVYSVWSSLISLDRRAIRGPQSTGIWRGSRSDDSKQPILVSWSLFCKWCASQFLYTGTFGATWLVTPWLYPTELFRECDQFLCPILFSETMQLHMFGPKEVHGLLLDGP